MAQKKVTIRVTDRRAGLLSGLIYSVDFMAPGYGMDSPCADEDEVRDAIEYATKWILREGDKPVLSDEREERKLLAWIK